MRVVIPGGSGHLGTLLARSFSEGGHEVVVISRNRGLTRPWRWVAWDGRRLGRWAEEIDGADAVINLAGRSVDCRYTKKNQREILLSRVDSTRVVGEAIAASQNPPHVWLQASTATIYAHRFDAPNDEHTGLIGGNEQGAPKSWHFSIDVARAWERALDEANTPRTRKVKLRSAIVMNAGDGGPFDIYLRLVRFGLGGAHGGGRQWMSWIHSRDFVRAVNWLIDRRFVDGAVNLAAPNPLTNAEFLRELRQARGRGFGLPATKLMLEGGAFLLRTETELLLKSRRVVPARLIESGFRFDFPTWPEAARDLCEEWRRRCERTISIQSQPVR
jgi:uncharacterized protein (TIGR01777 family)